MKGGLLWGGKGQMMPKPKDMKKMKKMKKKMPKEMKKGMGKDRM